MSVGHRCGQVQPAGKGARQRRMEWGRREGRLFSLSRMECYWWRVAFWSSVLMVGGSWGCGGWRYKDGDAAGMRWGQE